MGLADEYKDDVKLLCQGVNKFKGRPKALSDPMFAAYTKAVYFLLADKNFIDTGLKHLEAALIAEVGGEKAKEGAIKYFGMLESYFKSEYLESESKKGHPEKDDSVFHDKLKGALVRVLHASQARGGFSVEKRITIAKSTDPGAFSNIKAFAKLQTEAQHFKDINAGAAHGEYTHQIQWYFLTALWDAVQSRMADEFKATNGVYPDACDYYDYPAQLMWLVGETGTAAVGLWPMLFDRVTNTVNGVYLASQSTELDGRCPEILHLYMRHLSKPPCKLLTAFLRARYAKRTVQESKDFDYYKHKTSSNKFLEINDIGYLAKK